MRMLDDLKLSASEPPGRSPPTMRKENLGAALR